MSRTSSALDSLWALLSRARFHDTHQSIDNSETLAVDAEACPQDVSIAAMRTRTGIFINWTHTHTHTNTHTHTHTHKHTHTGSWSQAWDTTGEKLRRNRVWGRIWKGVVIMWNRLSLTPERTKVPCLTGSGVYHQGWLGLESQRRSDRRKKMSNIGNIQNTYVNFNPSTTAQNLKVMSDI